MTGEERWQTIGLVNKLQPVCHTWTQEDVVRIARIKDEDIDFSDIPELTDGWFALAVRGKFYRPVKEMVSIRLDTDALAFYRAQGAGYQTRINDTLRAAVGPCKQRHRPAEARRVAELIPVTREQRALAIGALRVQVQFDGPPGLGAVRS